MRARPLCRYLTLLASLCVVGGAAVERNQNLVASCLFEDAGGRNAALLVGLRTEDRDNREFVVDWCAGCRVCVCGGGGGLCGGHGGGARQDL